jgi:hypothetical protein
MEDPTSHAAAPPPSDPEATLREAAYAAAVDLAELARHLPGDASNASVLDKISEEAAEAAAMLRALPARPAAMSGWDYQLLAGLRTAHAAREDIGETIARALARLAAELGGSRQVLTNRPGSWEASAVRELMRGTVGPDDEAIDAYGPGAGGSL